MDDDDADPPALPPSGEQHGHPEEGMECLATMEDITTEDGNYCEYQTAPSNRWHPSKYSTDVVRRLLRTQFDEYGAGVRKADCHAELRRRLGKGPPIWIEDKHALPLPKVRSRIGLQSGAHSVAARIAATPGGGSRPSTPAPPRPAHSPATPAAPATPATPATLATAASPTLLTCHACHACHARYSCYTSQGDTHICQPTGTPL